MAQNGGKTVTYFYDREIGEIHYADKHPMVPHRLEMTHSLISAYGLLPKLEWYRLPKATAGTMLNFHSDDYIEFLQSVIPSNSKPSPTQRKRYRNFNIDGDCPIFENIFKFCQLSVGGSVGGAVKLNKQESDICINWAGGLHHAKKSNASGFCYVNDIVLAILELLKHHQRVLYIDIDVHHGDGVEEAFYTTDRVMTLSFHMYEKFYFPESGDIDEVGCGAGKYYAVNVPLQRGIADESYHGIFVPVVTKVIETYRPSVIVLQCGADSLAEDRLGCFNLTIKGHGKCVEFVKTFNVPLLLLGGGGYTVENVSRCWVYETAVALNVEIPNELPASNKYSFGPTDTLHYPSAVVPNLNTQPYLDDVKCRVFENLRMLPHAPSAQIRTIPEDAIVLDSDDEDVFIVDHLPEVSKNENFEGIIRIY